MPEKLLPLIRPFRVLGEITECRGSVVRCRLPGVSIGDLVEIRAKGRETLATVSGFEGPNVSLSPFEDTRGIQVHSPVELCSGPIRIAFKGNLRGKSLDAFGTDLCRRPVCTSLADSITPLLTLDPPPRHLEERAPVEERIVTGLRGIDAFTPIARGQRLLVAAEAGAGKSTLLRMLAENAHVDIVILALVGERNREAAELLAGGLSEAARARTVAVISTGDEPPARRKLSAQTATRLAEAFAEEGRDVLLLFDSLTRYLRAAREVALAAGEPPVRRGYPASVFAELPKLLERPGAFRKGSITAFYSMILTSELDEDPMVDEVRSILDGHLILRREIAEKGVFPALSIPESLSRIARVLTSERQREASTQILRLLSRLAGDRRIALFAERLDPELATALALEEDLRKFLGQESFSSLEETYGMLEELAEKASITFGRYNQEWQKSG